MRALVCLVVSLAACTSNGDDCQDLGGLFFDSADTNASMPTAAGGTQRFIGSTDACNGRVPLDQVLAVTEDPTVATVQVVDNAIEVKGVAAGDATVKVSSKEAGGLTSFRVIAIDHVALAGETGNVVFASAMQLAQIQLLGVGNVPCVDRTLTVTGPLTQGDRWDQLVIGTAPAGDYVETIHAGGADWPMTVTVVR